MINLQKKGFTFVELLVAIVVIGIGVVALSSLITGTSRQIQVGLNESSLLKTLESLESQIVAESIYTAPVDKLPDPLDLDAAFANSEISDTRCYSSTLGELVMVPKVDDPTIFICPLAETTIQLSYFKTTEVDTEITSTKPAQVEMAKLPLYRYHFRVKYGKEMADKIDFSRLIVGVMPF